MTLIFDHCSFERKTVWIWIFNENYSSVKCFCLRNTFCNSRWWKREKSVFSHFLFVYDDYVFITVKFDKLTIVFTWIFHRISSIFIFSLSMPYDIHAKLSCASFALLNEKNTLNAFISIIRRESSSYKFCKNPCTFSSETLIF